MNRNTARHFLIRKSFGYDVWVPVSFVTGSPLFIVAQNVHATSLRLVLSSLPSKSIVSSPSPTSTHCVDLSCACDLQRIHLYPIDEKQFRNPCVLDECLRKACVNDPQQRTEQVLLIQTKTWPTGLQQETAPSLLLRLPDQYLVD
jgi:hypothetical protein